MRFEQRFLTDGLGDSVHASVSSFGNLTTRVPGSNHVTFNKINEIIKISPEAEVRVIRCWDGNRPSVEHLFPKYYIHRQVGVMREIDKQIDDVKYNYSNEGEEGPNTISWIETLLNIPIHDFRKYCCKFILARYLVKMRKLSIDETSKIMRTWLTKCDSVHKLDFDIQALIDESIGMIKVYLPQARLDVKAECPTLYSIFEEKGIVY